MRTAILFPGQGSQVTGMGRSVAEDSSDAMGLWKLAEQCSGLELRSIYWESNDAELMSDTRALQSALTVVYATLWNAALPYLRKAELEPCCAAGHSLGEYGALVASGALRADDAVKLASLRGALMADADPDGRGGMAAVVKIPLDEIQRAIDEAKQEIGDERELLLIANYNTPAQYVVSGTKDAIGVLAPYIKARKGRLLPLAVSGAFHSPMMSEAAKKLSVHIAHTQWATPSMPVYPNTLGKAVSDRDGLRQELSVQMTSPVRWIETIGNQWKDGVEAWIELGPKSVLSKMVKPNLEKVGASLEQIERMPVLFVDSMEAIYGLRAAQ